MPLPRIVNANYESYKNDAQFRRIYTVLWGGTYDYGWDIGLGSHLGVDIATSAGTPVLAIADGVVDRSDTVSGWGVVITIKHTLADKTVIYSNYAHLSQRVVSKGDSVRLGQKIGEVGNTGISYGNHLHFQIDITNQLHPYYYSSCAKGKNPINIVNA
jgi:murein DD-endopeptidase MepM/ murein hydrolase activator NlpD